MSQICQTIAYLHTSCPNKVRPVDGRSNHADSTRDDECEARCRHGVLKYSILCHFDVVEICSIGLLLQYKYSLCRSCQVSIFVIQLHIIIVRSLNIIIQTSLFIVFMSVISLRPTTTKLKEVGGSRELSQSPSYHQETHSPWNIGNGMNTSFITLS